MKHFWDCSLVGSSLFGESLVRAGCIAIDFWVHSLVGFCLPEGVWSEEQALIQLLSFLSYRLEDTQQLRSFIN